MILLTCRCGGLDEAQWHELDLVLLHRPGPFNDVMLR